jgi:tartrate-resistant acid phosphatase type 5
MRTRDARERRYDTDGARWPCHAVLWRRALLLATLARVVSACDETEPTILPDRHDSHQAAQPNWNRRPADARRGIVSPDDLAQLGAKTPATAEPINSAPANPAARVRYVVMGDYGWAGPAEQRVAEMVNALEPDYVLTTGDNNYPSGSAATIDQNIGQYFADFIFPYQGSFRSRSTSNRFFPVLGNHDWDTDGASPYLKYFTLPANERYYDVVLGPLHFFAIDSDEREPDGIDLTSIQARWLETTLRASRSTFNVVAMHHPPFSSGPHGDTRTTQWPYGEWGADLVVAGHDHGYERLEVGGLTYVVSGLGGAVPYSFAEPVHGSLFRYSAKHGVALLEADARALQLSFVDSDGDVVDSATIVARSR